MTDREPSTLGEVLRTAREAKFIDLARVERDTRIQARYLSALEHGNYRDLPGDVYAKGFVRNYGLYLGLDPDYLVSLYRLERSRSVAGEASTARRPLGVRRPRSVVVSSTALAAVILAALVLALVLYLVGELVTFGRIPELRITDPAADLAGYQRSAYTILGVTEPNSTISTDGLRENPTATADAAGAFSVKVSLVPGANVITLVASDPLTGRDSAAVRRTITVITPAP